MSCSTTRTLSPSSSRAARRSVARRMDSSFDSPDDGSSSRRRYGSAHTARPSSTILDRPIGSSPARFPAYSSSPTVARTSRARSRASERCSTVGGSARTSESSPPRGDCDSIPMTRFSSTVSDPNSSSRWNVRPTRSLARLCDGQSVTSYPKRWTRPETGFTFPVITLNSVVFPAPLGPMSPTICPAPTLSETVSSALTPPNRTETSVASRGAALSAISAGRTAHDVELVDGESRARVDAPECIHSLAGRAELSDHHEPVEDVLVAPVVAVEPDLRALERRDWSHEASGVEVLEAPQVGHHAGARGRAPTCGQGLPEHHAAREPDDGEGRGLRAAVARLVVGVVAGSERRQVGLDGGVVRLVQRDVRDVRRHLGSGGAGPRHEPRVRRSE